MKKNYVYVLEIVCDGESTVDIFKTKRKALNAQKTTIDFLEKQSCELYSFITRKEVLE